MGRDRRTNEKREKGLSAAAPQARASSSDRSTPSAPRKQDKESGSGLLDQRFLLVAAGLIVLVWFIYSPVGRYDFVEWDDPAYVNQNYHVTHGLTWSNIKWAFTSEHAGYWLPVTWMSYMVDVQLFGVNPGAIHLVNVLLHAANTLLLLWLLIRITGDFWRSAVVTALFAVHPLRVESVAWITERKDVLSAFFGLLAILSYLSFLRKRSALSYAGMLAFFALAVMAKPMLVTLPAMLLLLDLWPLRRLSLEKPYTAWMPVLREKLPLLAVAAGAGVLTFFAQRRSGAVTELEALPAQLRFSNVILSYVAYLRDTIWPARLEAFYPYPASIPVWQVLFCLLLLIGISVLVIREARRFPYAIVGWSWYLGTLLPVIGLVQAGLQSRGDRFTYVPSIGLFILVAWGLPDLLARWRPAGRTLVLAAGVATLAYAVQARNQVSSWESSLALWTHAVSVDPGNAKAQGLNGLALERAERYDEAAARYKEAIRLKPDFAEPHNGLGNIAATQGRMSDAVAEYRESIRINPKFGSAHNNLGNLFSKLGRLDEAVAEYEAALRADSGLADAHNGLGAVLADQGKVDAAIQHYTEALRIDPDLAAARNNLGTALAEQGKLDQAIAEFLESVRVKPDANVHFNIGMIQARQGKFADALKHYQTALQIDPNNANARMGIQQLGNRGR